jgi:D-alanyl-D-alanine carboxypeptidase
MTVEAWLGAAIEYIGMWIAFQVRQVDQPGCAIAIAKRLDVIHEKSFGVADLNARERLTERFPPICPYAARYRCL